MIGIDDAMGYLPEDVDIIPMPAQANRKQRRAAEKEARRKLVRKKAAERKAVKNLIIQRMKRAGAKKWELKQAWHHLNTVRWT